jgi:hypothetical protein
MAHFRLDGLTNKQHYEKTNILTAVMTFTNIGPDGLTNKQHYEKTNILTAVMTFTNIGPLCTCVIFAASHNTMKNNQELNTDIFFQVLQGLRRPKIVSIVTERSVSS